MNAQETLSILSALKSMGATRFKSQDFEVELSPTNPLEQLPIPPRKSEPAHAQPFPLDAQSQPVEENKNATEKLQGLIKTLQLSPEELLDVVMPAGAGG